MRWTKGEPEPETPDTIVVVHKNHGPMLATWQPHRSAFIGVKPTGDTYGPFFQTNLEAGSILKWMKIG
ncbi:hypothetical protein [Phyllobacterium sp. K27]